MSTPAWLNRHLRIPCTVWNRVPAGTDEYGNVIYDDVSIDTVCYIQPASQEEIQDGRAEVGQFLVHLRAELAGQLDGFARIEIGGESFEAGPPPAAYPTLLRPDVHHVEITVQRSTA